MGDSLPSKEDYKKVKKLFEEYMPDFQNLIENTLEIMINDEQDLVVIFFAPPGKGKSNLALLFNVYSAYYLEKKFGLKNRFSLDHTEWKGLNYLTLFEKPAKQYVKAMEEGYNRKIVDEWKGTIFWLDEAADINALENLSTFNIEMNKHLATLREMQFIYVWCIDNPMKLLPDIRTYRVNMGVYLFATREKRRFEDGKIRNVRAFAIYGKKEWLKIAAADLKDVRVSLLQSQVFLNRFKPWRINVVPMYPRTPFFYEYKRRKALRMGQRIMDSIKKVKEKVEGKKNKKKEDEKIKMLKAAGLVI